MTVAAFTAAVRRYRLTYLFVVVVILGVTLPAIILAPNRYVSTTRLMVSVDGSTTAAAYQNDEVATRRVRSYIPLITSGVVSQRVIDALGLPLTPAELDEKVDVANVPPKTPLIDIEVTDDSPARARQIARAFATEFIRYTSSIETPTGEDNHKVHTIVVTPATESRENHLIPILLGALAVVAAVLVGAVAVWIRAMRAREESGPGQHARHADPRCPAAGQKAAVAEDDDITPPIERDEPRTTEAIGAVEDPVGAAEHS